jgi:small conductance mechanosensitive channel
MGILRDIFLKIFESLNVSVEISNLLTSLIVVVIWIFVGVISIYVVRQILFKVFKIKDRGPRSLTIGKLVSSISKYAIWFIIVMIILSELEIDITPFIASAGVLGLAIGFGAQSVVKDFISGFFIIFEESFNVGDVIEIDSFKGTVLDLGFRTTKLKDWKGDIKIVRNGDINSLINFSKAESTAIIDFGVSYKTDLNVFKSKMEVFIESEIGKYPAVIEPPKFVGITQLADSSINMRIIAKTNPNQQYQVERDIRSDLVLFFKENDIEIPFPQLVIHNEQD